MKILDTIATAFSGKKQPPAVKIAELIAAAETEATAARDRVAELEASRAETVLQGEAARNSHRAALAAARDDVIDADGAIETLRTRLADTREREAEAARKAKYEHARDAATAVAGGLPALLKKYETEARSLRDTVRQIAEIDAVITTANENLPDGVRRLEDSSDLRKIPSVAKEVVSEKTVDLWCQPYSQVPLAESLQRTVMAQHDGTGYSSPPGAQNPLRHDKHRFVRREIREETAAVFPATLAQLHLPAVYAWQSPIFNAASGTAWNKQDLVADVERCIAAEKASKRDNPKDRPIKIEHELVRTESPNT